MCVNCDICYLRRNRMNEAEANLPGCLHLSYVRVCRSIAILIEAETAVI